MAGSAASKDKQQQFEYSGFTDDPVSNGLTSQNNLVKNYFIKLE